MPQEPKRKHSKGRKRTRRASIFLESASLIVCTSCGEKILPHLVCKYCGFYAGKQVGKKQPKVQVTKA